MMHVVVFRHTLCCNDVPCRTHTIRHASEALPSYASWRVQDDGTVNDMQLRSMAHFFLRAEATSESPRL